MAIWGTARRSIRSPRISRRTAWAPSSPSAIRPRTEVRAVLVDRRGLRQHRHPPRLLCRGRGLRPGTRPGAHGPSLLAEGVPRGPRSPGGGAGLRWRAATPPRPRPSKLIRSARASVVECLAPGIALPLDRVERSGNSVADDAAIARQPAALLSRRKGRTEFDRSARAPSPDR